jgi:hypothetical protein
MSALQASSGQAFSAAAMLSSSRFIGISALSICINIDSAGGMELSEIRAPAIDIVACQKRILCARIAFSLNFWTAVEQVFFFELVWRVHGLPRLRVFPADTSPFYRHYKTRKAARV